MKVDRDLVFRGNAPAIAEFLTELEHRMAGGWSRDRAREEQLSIASLTMYSFYCNTAGERIAAHLWLAAREDGLHLTNVVPTQLPSLTHDQHNAIVQEFHDCFGSPAARLTGVEVELGKSELQLEEFLPPSAARMLRAVAASRVLSPPFDRERWHGFLLAAHREGTSFRGPDLHRWLVEEGNWPEHEASALASQYQQALELLGANASQPG